MTETKARPREMWTALAPSADGRELFMVTVEMRIAGYHKRDRVAPNILNCCRCQGQETEAVEEYLKETAERYKTSIDPVEHSVVALAWSSTAASAEWYAVTQRIAKAYSKAFLVDVVERVGDVLRMMNEMNKDEWPTFSAKLTKSQKTAMGISLDAITSKTLNMALVLMLLVRKARTATSSSTASSDAVRGGA